MVFLVAQQDVVQKWTVRWEELTGYLKRFCMPELGLVRLFCDVELLKIVDFLFKLNYKAYLSAYAKVADAEEADSLQEGEPV